MAVQKTDHEATREWRFAVVEKLTTSVRSGKNHHKLVVFYETPEGG
jgi:hypothetical protein